MKSTRTLSYLGVPGITCTAFVLAMLSSCELGIAGGITDERTSHARRTINHSSADPTANAPATKVRGDIAPSPTNQPTMGSSRTASGTTKLRVKTQPVSRRTLDEVNSVTGVVQAFRKSIIAAEIGGRVSKRLIEPGTQVRANQTLIQLDATQTATLVNRAKAQVNSRRVDLQQAQYDLEKGQRLITTRVISEDTLDDFGFAFNRAKSNLLVAEAELADAQRQFDDTRIRAAFKGTAEVIHVQQGDYLSPGTPVVTIADFTKARVVAGVTAHAAQYLEPNQTAQVRLQGLATRPLAAKIQSIGRIADGNGTFPVELWVEGNASNNLREGMVASVVFSDADTSAHPALPRSALLRRGGGMYVFVLDGDIAKLRAVDVGRSDTNYAQILQGVELGDEVVVDGLFALSDGAKVELAN